MPYSMLAVVVSLEFNLDLLLSIRHRQSNTRFALLCFLVLCFTCDHTNGHRPINVEAGATWSAVGPCAGLHGVFRDRHLAVAFVILSLLQATQP